MSHRPRMLMTPNGGPPALQAAAPLNDYQITALMAALIAAHGPEPGSQQERDTFASRAVIRAIDLLGHAAYQQGRGTIASTIQRALATGQQAALAALEAEEARQRGESGEGTEPPPPPASGLVDEHGNPQTEAPEAP